jgi:hypothetical protein
MSRLSIWDENKMMTLKDYNLVAISLQDSYDKFEGDTELVAMARSAIRSTAIHLAKIFRENNNKFDPSRFLEMCGF